MGSKGYEQEGTKVYIGNLERSGDEEEIEREFRTFGPLRQVWVARNPPGFAFVIFQDPRDAEDAVKELDGKILCGHRVRVEVSHGRSRWGSGRGRGGGRYGGQRRSPPTERYGRDRDDGQRGRMPYDDRYGERDRRPPPRDFYEETYGGGHRRERGRDTRDEYREPYRRRSRSRSPGVHVVRSGGQMGRKF
ncbi:serine/arginine-rich splicing factor 3-like [Corticium candelabrum]|uniref:serine/arginine-rich splicing factor 3-like n=1 Tax=Corticium candelabrum TaxID=121492 RepID=UPI002E274E6E|nr:serine/arginine-rich splicing factor 3-like [Corticium candelabrum]